MSYSLALAFDTNNVIGDVVTVPAPVGWIKRTWLNITGQELPTMDVPTFPPHIHTLELDETHDASTVDSILTRMENQGYDILSVQYFNEYGVSEELSEYWDGMPSFPELSSMVEAMYEDVDHSDAIAAFVTNYGWQTSYDMESHHYGTYDSPRDFAVEYVEASQTHVDKPVGWYGQKESVPAMDAVPECVQYDWDGTADYLENDGFTYVRFLGNTHVFTY